MNDIIPSLWRALTLLSTPVPSLPEFSAADNVVVVTVKALTIICCFTHYNSQSIGQFCLSVLLSQLVTAVKTSHHFW